MKKNQSVFIIVLVILAAVGGWFGYRHFFRQEKTTVSTTPKRSARAFAANSCWVYHEYVYRVDFSDDSLESFLFVRNADGTFSPSEANKPGNEIIGNGFIVDSSGACLVTDKMSNPWVLSTEEQFTLKELVDAWLDLKPEIWNRGYRISGQTVALFVVLNDPKDFIEYSISAPVPGQEGYSLLYPVKKLNLTGINSGIAFSGLHLTADTSILQVVKTSFDEHINNPMAITSIDSIAVTKNEDGFFENIIVLSGDNFFYEGAAVFDEYGKLAGNLRYENNKWALNTITSIVQNAPAYAGYDPPEQWEFNTNTASWKKAGERLVENRNNSEGTYKPGPLESTIKVYPSPTPSK